MVKHKRRAKTAALALVAGSWAGLADAHPEFAPTLVNRYVTVLAHEDRVSVFYILNFGTIPGEEERKRIDDDGDGAVSDAERMAAARRWQARADDLIEATVDGKPLSLTGGEALVGLGAQGMVTVEMGASHPLAAGEHTIRVEPKQDPPRAGETEIAVDPLPGHWDLASSRRAADPPGTQARFKLDGPRASVVEDRSFTFVLRPASLEVAQARSRPRLVLALAGAALTLGAAGALLLRRNRRPAARS